MYCRHCGSELKNGVHFCPKCGAKIEQGPTTEEKQGIEQKNFKDTKPDSDRKKGSFPVLIPVLAGCIILLLGAVFVFGKGMSKNKISDVRETTVADSSSNNKKDKAKESDSEPEEETEENEAAVPLFAETEKVRNSVQIQMVSSDVKKEEYPVARIYFRVKDTKTEDSIGDMDASDFVIYESVEGGEYLSREIKSAEKVKSGNGVAISLVADKSSSIANSDMDKIKNIICEFIDNLDYSHGDTVELLAFDSIVQQMCSFTNNVQWLKNGVNNMYPDGMTALFDALYEGVYHAGVRGGARCVIGFTDGIDNSSQYSFNEVIELSKYYQVPIYIIGVKSSESIDEDTLRQIAESTGGMYWNIDDLYSLGLIYEQIYTMQNDMYCVSYISDSSAAIDCERSLKYSIDGDSYVSEEVCEPSFALVEALDKVIHSSRYEVIKQDCTWEEAAVECERRGGHLITITSDAEEQEAIRLSENAGLKYVWIGGYTSYDEDGNVFGHWITGEPFDYSNWSIGEPSRVDMDGTDEWYLMLWDIKRLGGWTWNDQRNDPGSVNPAIPGNQGFICEYEE